MIIAPPPLAGQYRTLVVDPPWAALGGRVISLRGDKLPYDAMSLADIGKMPIGEWAAPDSMLFLWVLASKLGDPTRVREMHVGDRTQCILHAGFELMAGWGFSYTQTLVWVKSYATNPTFTPFCPKAEFVLVGWRGNFRKCYPKESTGKLETVFHAPNQVHSQKPAEFYSQIARHFPGPRLEVFARNSRPDYDGWGDEYSPANGKGKLFGGK